jgi:hypothetical protein
MLTALTVIAAIAGLAMLAAPKSKLEAWWQASTAHFLYQEARKQLDAAQAQPRPTPPPAQGEQAK